jgi:uncharacterized membrane protein (UPF0127 family)
MRAATPPELSVKRWHWWRLRVGLFSGVRVGLFLGLFLGLFSGLVLAGTMPAMAQEDRLDFARGEIALVGINDGTNAGTNDGTKDGTNDGRAVIAVEFARNEAERRQGLMYREELAAGTGMLFIFAGEGMRGFWMKNTLIALDMVFFDSAGRFVSLHRDVPPLTLASRQSAGPAQYVLELNAGEAKQLGIGPETRLVLPVELPPELPPELPVELVPEE